MTNFPQQPNGSAMRGMGEGALSDPGVRMILSMSPQDGSIKPIPENLKIDQQSNGSFTVKFPDGSVRELIPGAEGEGRMITTLTDGTRIQSDLTMGQGQVSVASISSTGEKTFLSLNENGVNMQRITPSGDVSNVVPESAPQLIQSFREADAFAQAEQLRQQEQEHQPVDEWNDLGKPADWQPPQFEQMPQEHWQPPQEHWQPPQQHFEANFNQPVAFIPPQNFAPQEHWQPVQELYNGWFNQPAAFMPPQNFMPQQNWQPAPQHFDGGFNAPVMGFPPPPMTDASGFPIGFPEGPAHVMGEMFNHVEHVAGFDPSGFVQELDPNNQNELITEFPPQY